MTITIKINTENAAFENRNYELGRILDVVQGLVLAGETRGSLRDSNGNTVGSVTVTGK